MTMSDDDYEIELCLKYTLVFPRTGETVDRYRKKFCFLLLF